MMHKNPTQGHSGNVVLVCTTKWQFYFGFCETATKVHAKFSETNLIMATERYFVVHRKTTQE